MSKKLKKIITALFIINTFLVAKPNCLNIMNAKVYAEEKPLLKNIYLSEGNDIDFKDDIYTYVVDVDKDTEDAFIKAKPDDPDDKVKINGQVVTKDDNYKENISLDQGKNKIEIEVSDDKTKSKSVYTVYVYRGGKDAVYLEDININDSSIGFNKAINSYDIELDDGTDIVELQAITDEGNYTITANGKKLDETNSIKARFNGIGKYTINIGLKDEDTQRVGTYTLNIYLGIPVTPNVPDSINAVIKPNQWVIVNGRWRYNDSLGNHLEDTWFYDDKYKSYFHFNSRGNMQTGWIEEDGTWYYLKPNGEMYTGWLDYKDNWYLLDNDGDMRVGWVQRDGKWYYLRKDGTMATGWIVSKNHWYFLNSSGAMETGWIYYGKRWYYLDSSGLMCTGWISDNGQWYFMNPDGSMKSGEWLHWNGNWYYLNYVGNMRCGWLYKDDKYYYLNEDGTMRTGSLIIDGYMYNFNEDGSVNFG